MNFNYSNFARQQQQTPVSQKIAGRENEMSQNNGGGVTFDADKFVILDRFLNLGATHGTFHLSQQKHQYNNLENIIACIKQDGAEVVCRIVEVSTDGLAQKNDHAIFALAMVFTHGNVFAKNMAKANFNKVVRTGTHLFMFCDFIKSMRGFGKLVREAVADWYNKKSDISMARQVSKYQSREGWSHLDVFRLSHPRFEGSKNQIAKWAMGKDVMLDSTSEAEVFLQAVNEVKTLVKAKDVISMIEKFGLDREHVPTNFLNMAEVQEAMLPHMGGTAMLRNLGNMSKSGLLSPFSKASKFVIERFKDKSWIAANRLHPLSILVAQRVYGFGRGLRGNGTWDVNPNIVEALEDAFYLSFDAIEPTGKNYFYALDVSGSMSSSFNDTPLRYCEVAAVLAMAHLRTEANTFVGGFSDNFVDLGINKKDSLAQASKKCVMRNFGSTNPSAAIDYAIKHKIPADCFIVITDNEVNSGIHPTQALGRFRKTMQIPQAKMIVCGLAANNFTIADPKDPNQLDVAGFSPDLTSVISSFTK